MYGFRAIKKQFEEIGIRYKKDIPNVVLRAVGVADGAEEGVYVFITGRRQSELDAALKQIGKKRHRCSGEVEKIHIYPFTTTLKKVVLVLKSKRSLLQQVYVSYDQIC